MVQFSFFSQNMGLLITVIAIACILLGRIWSNAINWGEITDPQLIVRNGEYYKVINVYLPKGWTDGWEIGGVLCLECFQRKFFVKRRREIYVSADRIRFTDEGPNIGGYYKASFSNASSGSIVMRPVKHT